MKKGQYNSLHCEGLQEMNIVSVNSLEKHFKEENIDELNTRPRRRYTLNIGTYRTDYLNVLTAVVHWEAATDKTTCKTPTIFLLKIYNIHI